MHISHIDADIFLRKNGRTFFFFYQFLVSIIPDQHCAVRRLAKLEPLVLIVLAINNASSRVIHLTNLQETCIILSFSEHHSKICKVANKLKAAADLF